MSCGLGVLALGLLIAVVWRRPLSAGPRVRMLLAAALVPPVGLLLLGAAFNNTPIELRYLSFGVPFIALLLAWACDPGVVRSLRAVGLGCRVRPLVPEREAGVGRRDGHLSQSVDSRRAPRPARRARPRRA